ncbi:MAG: LamG domain-containing protein, partial [Kiritimatiellae bacterium]|nr:LamG domain-containing protein [Kiritimatiellia bacterium]
KNPTEQNVKFPSGCPYFDGKWHHLAVSFSSTGSTTEIKQYFDYDLKGTETINGALETSVSGTLMIGESWNGDSRLNGRLDEIRVHAGAVGPESFLRSVSKPGFVLVVR